MISISKFKANFYALFRLMRDTGMYVDAHNNGRVYRIHIEDMKTKYKFRDNKRSYTGAIETDVCPACGKLMINVVCMNDKCPAK